MDSHRHLVQADRPISSLKGKWWKHLVHFTVDCATVATFSNQATIGAPSQKHWLGSILVSRYSFVVDLIFPEMSVQELWPACRIRKRPSTD